MKLLFDQNLSYKLIDQLKDHFPHSVHVTKLRLQTATDEEVWNYAKKHECIIVTQDSDYNDRVLQFGPPPHVVWIRAGNVRTNHIKNLLTEHHQKIKEFAKQKEVGCYTLYDAAKQITS